MKLEDIIKTLEDKEVESGVIAAIKSLDNSAEVDRLKGELESEQGKNAGILADKKKYKERADTAEEALKKIEHDKLPEEERHVKELQELKDKLEAADKQREADKAEYAKTQREAKLADLTSTVKWADGTPHDTAKMIISTALSGVEDLSDSAKVDEVLATVKESHKSFIAADAPAGSGGKGGSGGGNNSGGGGTPSIADNQAEIWGTK